MIVHCKSPGASSRSRRSRVSLTGTYAEMNTILASYRAARSIANSTALSAVPDPSVPTATVRTIRAFRRSVPARSIFVRRCRGRTRVASWMAIDEDKSADLSVAPIVGPDDPRRFTDSGIEVKPLYTERRRPGDLDERLGEPGEFPFTRGPHREMYRKQLWTMRQYAGYASAKESNERYQYLLAHGSTGLSMAFDLPTQLGLDSDDPRCLGEVGRTGVAIDTLDDMRTAFDGIPLDEVSTSMTINAPASVLLLLYQLVGEEQGVEPDEAARAPSRTTSSRSTSRAGTSSTRPSRRCG